MTDRFSRNAALSVLLAAVLTAPCVSCGEGTTLTLEAEPGLNYETVDITPHVTGASAAARLKLVATDPEKGTVSADLPIATQAHQFTERTAARTVVLDGYVTEGSTTKAETHGLLLMGNPHDDGWIDEDAETFKGDRKGSGTWTGKQFGSVSNGMIVVKSFENQETGDRLTCAFGTVPTPRRGYTLMSTFVFDEVAYELFDPDGQVLGLMVAAPGEGEKETDARFHILDGGAWRSVAQSVCNPTVTNRWAFHIAVDCTAKVATYYVCAGGAGPWTILGTGSLSGTGDVSQMDILGEGAISGCQGNGFDAQLFQLDVTFDDLTLYPGCNFEETVVTGRVTCTEVHDTDRTGGTYKVRLVDEDGNVLAVDDFAFTGEGTMEFYISKSKLTAGAAYKAEVIFDQIAAEVNEDAGAERVAVMGRSLTNAVWGTRGWWVDENAATFRGEAPGTGLWQTNDATYGYVYASATNGWIQVKTVSSEEDFPVDAKVSFVPTNVLEESESGYVTDIRVVFSGAAYDPENVDALFGETVAIADDGLAFLCLSNGVWKTVPPDVFQPELGVAYTLTVHMDEKMQTLRYFVTLPSDEQFQVMTVDLDTDRCREFAKIDLYGVGEVTNLTGLAYSTDLLRVHTLFDADTLYPSTNFTATSANGIISFEPLWETDHTNGILRVVIRDKYGEVVGYRRISFHDLGDRPFDYYATGLVPGETYSVDVVAEVKGIDTEDISSRGDSTSGSMYRIVTNAVWGTNCWIRENADTFGGRRTGSGDWTYETGVATEDGEFISIDTTLSDEPSAQVSFVATNALPKHTGVDIRTRVIFDLAQVDVPTVSGRFGITLMDADPDQLGEVPTYSFMVLVNGVWTAVDREVYEPEIGTEYEVTIRIDKKEAHATYFVRDLDADASVPTVLTEFDLDGTDLETPFETDFIGTGRVRTHEGDGFDVSLVEITPEYDQTALEPGTNFASTVAKGVLHIKQIWLTDKTSGNYTISAKDAHGNVIASQTLSYQQLTNQNFNVVIEGLEAGEAYDIEITTDLEGEVVSSERIVVKMARRIGGWIDEDAATFLGEDPGTGLWSQTNGTTSVTGEGEDRVIRFDVGVDDPQVLYDPTNDTPSVRYSTLREVRMNLDFGDVGWFLSEDPPAAPSNTLAAAVVCGDDGSSGDATRTVALAVISTNGQWTVLENTRKLALLEGPCTVTALIDLENGFVRYTVAAGTETNRVHQYDFDPTGPRQLHLSFAGNGTVSSIDGDAWDPNLIYCNTNEYADLNAAIRDTAGSDDPLSPLWWANQLVTVEKGTFRTYDTNDWLTVRFPWWYYFEVTTNGYYRLYRFNQSNNWIDYAEGGDSNIVVNGSVFLVKTPEGLSWIAAQAQTNWIAGTIELAGDIDLSKHNWTPIAGFTGTFDGKDRTIRGLNNLFRNVGIPGGEYICGPTNGWGRSTYGLFGTATNSTLRDVTFAGVAISNVADSVASLVGALAGNCAVSNVTVESGSILGAGGTVAGVTGYADFDRSLVFVGNVNRADVTATNELYGTGRWAAGLLCVAGSTADAEPYGDLIVTNNANYGTVGNVIYDTDLFGGNVAQILAGTTLGAKFGEVHLTNNAAAGAVDAYLVRTAVNVNEVTNFPAVNLAPAFWGVDADDIFRRALDANVVGAVAVDPVYRTARMLSDRYINGATNEVGIINDRITALPTNSTVKLDHGLDDWGGIRLDRNDITFDLDGKTIFTIYVNDTFLISTGVKATVKNGTIVIGPESNAFAGDTSQLTQENLVIENIDEDFYERTVLEVDGDFTYAMDVSPADLNAVGRTIQLFEGSTVSIDEVNGTLCVLGVPRVRLSDAYAFSTIRDDDGTVLGYAVHLANNEAGMPTVSVPVNDASTISVNVGNTHAGVTYVLQTKVNLADAVWTDVPGASQAVEHDGEAITLEAQKSGSTGFYRVLATETPAP